MDRELYGTVWLCSAAGGMSMDALQPLQSEEGIMLNCVEIDYPLQRATQLLVGICRLIEFSRWRIIAVSASSKCARSSDVSVKPTFNISSIFIIAGLITCGPL